MVCRSCKQNETCEAEKKPDMLAQRVCGGGMQTQDSPELDSAGKTYKPSSLEDSGGVLFYMDR